jgi:hypothetical protein
MAFAGGVIPSAGAVQWAEGSRAMLNTFSVRARDPSLRLKTGYAQDDANLD